MTKCYAEVALEGRRREPRVRLNLTIPNHAAGDRRFAWTTDDGRVILQTDAFRPLDAAIELIDFYRDDWITGLHHDLCIFGLPRTVILTANRAYMFGGG